MKSKPNNINRISRQGMYLVLVLLAMVLTAGPALFQMRSAGQVPQLTVVALYGLIFLATIIAMVRGVVVQWRLAGTPIDEKSGKRRRQLLLPPWAYPAPRPAEYAIVRLLLDKRLRVADAAGLKVVEDIYLQIGEQKTPVTILTENWSIPAKLPIFEGVNFNLTDRKSQVQVSFPPSADSYFLGWEILSPRMLPKRQFYELVFGEGVVTLKQT